VTLLSAVLPANQPASVTFGESRPCLEQQEPPSIPPCNGWLVLEVCERHHLPARAPSSSPPTRSGTAGVSRGISPPATVSTTAYPVCRAVTAHSNNAIADSPVTAFQSNRRWLAEKQKCRGLYHEQAQVPQDFGVIVIERRSSRPNDYVGGAPNASAMRSIENFRLEMYMMGTPGILRMRRLSSLSHVATM